ncbi:alpha/beta hydrolase [Synechococcus sp. KORDI-52]|nr:alpha/beta hydrolase [Synechococcus sp. KORDI-52]
MACRQEALTLADGVVLRSRLWHPSGEGPWPALLMRQPYGHRIASTVTYAHPSWWASHGFLVVVQDVRGQGESGGSFGGFGQEAADTSATHAWVRQLPECNGRLGAYGFSYQGLTQLTGAEATPPPECTAPAMTGLDERRHWSCEGGAHWWQLGLGWGLQLAALQAQRRGDTKAWLEIRRSLDDSTYLRDGPRLLQRHDPDGMAWTWFQNEPAMDKQWTVHRVPKTWLQRPMLLIGGWWDPHLVGLLDLWHRSKAAGGQPSLHIGPASHLQWWPETQQLMLEFFQQHLQDRPPLEPTPAQQLWNITRHRWDAIPTPEAIGPSSWGLRGHGLACIDPSDGALLADGEGEGRVVIVHDPWRPVPAIGGHLGTPPGPANRLAVDQRSDVATFTSVPLGDELLLSGQPLLCLNALADQPGFDLCISLSRLPAQADSVEQLSTGVLRVRGGEALQNVRRSVTLQPLQVTLDPGDRLRISIAAAAWPAIGVNPGHDVVPCGAPSPDHRVVTLTLELAGSTLQLNPFDSGRLKLD